MRVQHTVLAIGLASFLSCAAAQTPSSPEAYQPVADPAAVVTEGNIRITVLTPQLLRLEWAADGHFEDHASFTVLNRKLPVPKFEVSHKDAQLSITTAALRLEYNHPTGVTPRFDATNLAIHLTVAGQEVTWHPGDKDPGNLLGTTRTLDQITGSNVPLEPGLVSRTGWSLVDDSARPLFDTADFSPAKTNAGQQPWVLQRPAGEREDWYFFGYGHDYRAALGDYVKVAGRIPLPPRFAFGIWWSRYWAYSDQELDELVNGFQQRNLPLDVLVIDMDWHLAFRDAGLDQSGHRKGWTGYTWNRNLFPEPQSFLTSLHDRGVKVTMNLHPASGIQPFEDAYPTMARAMGQDPAQGKYVPFQITDRKFTRNYFDLVHHPLEKQGVDFWWLDWQQEPATAVPGVNPTFWLNYVHFADQEAEGKRPLLFHRWGGLGSHRYQIGFSGDTISVWDSLAFQPQFTATAANVGYAYWSHDIGGHMPGAIEPELYMRWVQFGAFSPILRTHTTKNPDAERRVWAYPEPYSSILEDTFRQREAWIPYIYSEAHHTFDTGVAFLRPLYYDWPEQDESYKSTNEFTFGDNLIVAPVVHPVDPATALAKESIWLPQGEWIEAPTGVHLQGGKRADRTFSLEQTPVYMKPGSIVPKQQPMLHADQAPVTPLIVSITPLTDGQTSSYALYEDSSKGIGYKSGDFATTGLHATRSGNTLTVHVDPVRGHFAGMLTSRAFELQLPGDWPPSSVKINGLPLAQVDRYTTTKPGWRFEGNTLTTVIRTRSLPVAQGAIITITRNPALVAKQALLNGFAGRMVELRRAYAEMNSVFPIDDLVAAMQTGNRISFHPDRALAEIERLPTLIASAQKQLNDIEAEAKKHDLQFGYVKKQGADLDAQRRLNMQRLSRSTAALASAANPQ